MPPVCSSSQGIKYKRTKQKKYLVKSCMFTAICFRDETFCHGEIPADDKSAATSILLRCRYAEAEFHLFMGVLRDAATAGNLETLLFKQNYFSYSGEYKWIFSKRHYEKIFNLYKCRETLWRATWLLYMEVDCSRQLHVFDLWRKAAVGYVEGGNQCQISPPPPTLSRWAVCVESIEHMR